MAGRVAAGVGFAAYGAGVQGVSAYTAKTGGELRDTMAMCGAFAVKEITEEMLW